MHGLQKDPGKFFIWVLESPGFFLNVN